MAGGRIVDADRHGGGTADDVERVDLANALVVPGFVEGHVHLDKSWIGDTWKPHRPNTAGFDVHERVAFEKELLAGAAPMDHRASALLDKMIGFGTTHIRSHVDVDATVGLAHLETLLAVREAYRGRVDIEFVAFPQSGILACPGTADLLDQAFELGVDRIGGLDPGGFDRDVEAHLDVVFGIAERRDVDVDIHLHDPGELGVFELEEICRRTKALGMAGRVAVSHAYCLGDVDLARAAKTAERLADAGVAIMTNAPGHRPFPPVALLRGAGVTVFSGNDNIRDSWWPYGDGDMLGRAMMIGYRSGFFTDDEMEIAFDTVSHAGAKALRLEDYGLDPSCNADFVAIRADHVPMAVVGLPDRAVVVKAGEIVAAEGAVRDRP